MNVYYYCSLDSKKIFLLDCVFFSKGVLMLSSPLLIPSSSANHLGTTIIEINVNSIITSFFPVAIYVRIRACVITISIFMV